MFACWARQMVAERVFALKKTACSVFHRRLVASNSFRGSSRETVHSLERETGLEPATACLEGRHFIEFTMSSTIIERAHVLRSGERAVAVGEFHSPIAVRIAVNEYRTGRCCEIKQGG